MLYAEESKLVVELWVFCPSIWFWVLKTVYSKMLIFCLHSPSSIFRIHIPGPRVHSSSLPETGLCQNLMSILNKNMGDC